MDEIARAVRLEFRGLYASDRALGAPRALADYLALFPGHDRTVAEAFLEANAPSAPVAAAEREARDRVGPFQLVRELGRGAQGTVWLAEDERLGRSVALKLVPRSPLFDSVAPRFEREARVASRLDHAGICAVLDVGHDQRFAWIAMRFVEGETLAARIARGELGPLDERVRLLESVARALHVAHEAGVVHRDVKPANVMVTPGGEPVILDFGVARADEEGAPLTLTGDALGTPAYMAPEQLRGGTKLADRRADVWSLGVTAFETLTGRRPFDAPTRESTVRAILDDSPPDPRSLEPALSRDLAVVLATALEKDLGRRYRSALDLAEDLRRVRAREPIRARPASAWLRLRRWSQRDPKLAASVAALFVVLAAALAITSRLLSSTRSALDQKQAVLRDVAQLSDETLARELIDEERELWPATEEMLPRFDRWLERSRDLAGRRALHEHAKETIAARTDFDPDPVKNANARQWLIEQLDKLFRALDELDLRIARVAERREFASELRARSIEAHRAEWERAAAEVAADSRYAGLVLAPQLGLVPLGRDPRSGWQEFAHLESGSVPARDPASGELQRAPDCAIVLILLPAGSVDVGCEPPSDARPLGAPNVDPWTARWDGPVRQVELEPFFIGKYELTQGQWTRHARSNPSVYQAPSRLVVAERAASHPIESVDWNASERLLRELQLVLPTEAQWEYAARAGGGSVWPTGNEVASLAGFANLADRYAREHDGGENWSYDLSLDDGWVAHAPVGSFAPNAWGLHDTCGNLEEWCLDTWEDLATAEPRPGDGRWEPRDRAYSIRGGSFSSDATHARSGFRSGSPPNFSVPNRGLRAARRLER